MRKGEGMKTALSRLGLFLGAGFMVGHIITSGLAGSPMPYWHAGAALRVVLVGGVGWWIGWLVGWGLDRFTEGKKAE
jgi:hypothetical protein